MLPDRLPLKAKIVLMVNSSGAVKKNDRLSVAVSGGPDSTALLFLLESVKDELGIKLVACHLNHQLRGEESDKDEQFVKELAESLSIPFRAASANLPEYRAQNGGSTQSAARELRYQFFDSLIKSRFADKIAIGHTKDDSAETLLINFLRGTGLSGLTGIPSIREEKIIRPLIEVSKKEILAYLNENKIVFRTDSSNSSDKYLRNQIRNNLLPLLEREYNPALKDSLCRTSVVLSDIDDFISGLGDEALAEVLVSAKKEEVVVDSAKLKSYPKALQREVLRKIVAKVRGSFAARISFDRTEDLGQLLRGERSGELDLPGIKAVLSGERLAVRTSEFPKAQPFSYKFDEDSLIFLEEISASIEVRPAGGDDVDFDKSCRKVFLNGEAIPSDAVIRSRREGDRFYPLGADGSQKLKKFFIDQKLSKWERDSIPLLASGSDILWIPGYRISQTVRLPEQRGKILKLEYRER